MKDRFNAYMDIDVAIEPIESGKLDGLTFSVKDVFAIEGHRNTAGNPDYLRTHQPSNFTAPVITALLKDGAILKGTTHTDELMYSLNGENFHYGTPVNPKAPDHIPGGSSSGSAVAVAGESVDFALGTDTGGSVRVPSSYCGIYGIRPTHGLVDIKGVIPLADSFDTVGWMARSPEILQMVGEVLIEESSEDTSKPFKRLIYPNDAWELVLNDQIGISLEAFLPNLKAVCLEFEEIKLSKEGLGEWTNTFRVLQAMEIWEAHKEWIEKEHPTFGPGIKDRFEWASTLKKDEHKHKFYFREKISEYMVQVLGEDGILVIPTAPGIAPIKNLPSDELEEYRSRAMKLTCIAGLAGLPQVTLPVGEYHGKPVGLSLIANRNKDLQLLQFVNELSK
ncbi:amidase [Litchfieldia alkalitelluris]|uniref:amidase n=1 Tax=Litchfieldia alkalitelluris TaxID=304268 RepID=UPI000998D139|nr:amidase [Litchfieldia alkalitelluris]